MKQKRTRLLDNTQGFSTAFDIFLFLIMISICALILLPSITANTQIKSALESKSQKNAGDTLLTLLNARVDEFEYVVAGDQMDALAGSINKSQVYLAGKKIIAGKELKHRTFSDIASENAAVQWVIYYNGTRTQVNFIMTNYSNSSKNIMKHYLDEQIGDRYNYNFTVVWRPFTGIPVGGNLDIGEPVPDNAYVESTYITMPYHTSPSRKQVEEIIDANFNKSTFGNFSNALEELRNNETNRNEIERQISDNINDSIYETIEYSVDILVDEELGLALDDGKNSMIEDVSALVNSQDTLNQELNARINNSLEIINMDSSGTMADKLKEYLKKAAKEKIQAASGKEIAAFTTELSDLYVNNRITQAEAKERIFIEVFSRINVNRAQATLSLWGRKV